ncbi:MAG: hypothetical protein HY749_07285 [Gammaproteobacteria bacterium]|nr:hypothetical protein [Gammaproteobacteria bacterium]MBI5615773.1 hypothetical protein [Gammaproteobacteria bacterium]
MKIAIAVKDDFTTVSGHAGKAVSWLVYDCIPEQTIPAPQKIVLRPEQVMHHFEDEGPHPLDGVEIVIAGSAGDGFVRHMQARGAEVLLTGELEPAAALKKILRGEALAAQRFDVTTTLCRLRDLFSRY